MPEQDAMARARNFAEVNLGYTEQLAIMEADRCLQCPKPYCVDGCPVSVNIPNFIRLLGEGNVKARGRFAAQRQRPALRHRPGLPAGDPVRAGLPARQDRHAGRDRLPRALRRRLGHQQPRRLHRARPAPSGKTVAIVGSGPGRSVGRG